MPITQASAFKLHSRPGAPHRVLLDFDGVTTINTAWNAQYQVPVITTPPFDKVRGATVRAPCVATAVAIQTQTEQLVCLGPAMCTLPAPSFHSHPEVPYSTVHGPLPDHAACCALPCALQDGSPSTWSAAELADIVAIWRSVAEDFAPFDVDITTEDPGDVVMAANSTRVAIGGSYNDCECALGSCPATQSYAWFRKAQG